MVEALLRLPALWAIAAQIPAQETGRPRKYPAYMWVLYSALVKVWDSALKVEKELSHQVVWGFLRNVVQELFPDDESMWLPEEPMRAFNYFYGRDTYLAAEGIQEELQQVFRESAVAQALEMGCFPPNPSFTHPSLTSMIHGDGVRVKALYDAAPGDTFLDKETGEVKAKRFDPDAHHYDTRDKSRGTHWTHWEVRPDAGTVILDVEHTPHDEAGVATSCAVDHIRPLLDNLIGVLFDGAMRGKHHQRLLESGMMLVNRPHSEKNPGRKGKRTGIRVPKSRYLRDVEVTLPSGRVEQRPLYVRDGDFGLRETDENGEHQFVLLERVQTRRAPKADKTYRWYDELRLPPEFGGGLIQERIDITREDRERGFNRTEYTRAIGPSDPDFDRRYGRRNNSEQEHAWLKDALYKKRARSVGWRRQKAEMLGWALLINALALEEHRKRRLDAAA